MAHYLLGIWGQFGDGGKIADGQAVRTTIITRELQQRYGYKNIGVVNTNNWKKSKFSFLIRSLLLIAKSNVVLIAPADNGYKLFVPILQLFNLFFRRKLIHIVIGGFLPSFLKSNPFYLKLENNFNEIFVQTPNLQRDLTAIGVRNVKISSNPKRLNTRAFDEIKVIEDKCLKVCVFSRIYTDKGVEDALEAVKLCNETLGGNYLTIDFYGLVPDKYKERLQELLDSNKLILKYKGIIDFDKTVETLKEYFIMLFPTYYHGEGFPGNVVDAYNTGLPIIATDWLYNSDVILNGKTGLLVPIKNPEKLSQAILALYHDRKLHYKLSINSLKEAQKYTPEKVLKELFEYIDKNVNL